MNTRCHFFLLIIFVSAATRADTNVLLDAWLAHQSTLKTWTADLTQTRTLKTLKKPLKSKGRLTFLAPNTFRWQLGDPAQTIALRTTNEMVVIYPRLKQAERYPLATGGNEPWRDTLALMDAGFPTSRAELESRFKILSLTATNELAQLVLEPRGAIAKRFMEEVQIIVRTNDFAMIANQMKFADGSILRNDFTNAVINPDLPATAFQAEIPADFNVVEPMKKP